MPQESFFCSAENIEYKTLHVLGKHSTKLVPSSRGQFFVLRFFF